jgi:hypothetical protein
MRQVSTLEEIMEALDQRLKKLKISRSATQNFPGVKSETLNGWFSSRSRDMRTSIVLALLAGAGLEVWLREIPRTSTERKRYELEFAAWMASGGIKLEPDSEIQVEQVVPDGVTLHRLGKGLQ